PAPAPTQRHRATTPRSRSACSRSSSSGPRGAPGADALEVPRQSTPESVRGAERMADHPRRRLAMLERVRKETLLALLACAVLGGLAPAAAQTYPERPVTFIVPYGAGGPLDTVTRIITERMRVPLKQGTVIENVAGASGTIGVGRAVRAAPDGYTV